MPHSIPKPPRLDMSEADWRALTKPGAQAIAAMQKQITTLTGRVNSNPSSSPLDFSGKDGGISDELTVLQERAKTVEESIQRLQGTLGNFSYNREFQKGMKDVVSSMDEFIGQGKEGERAYSTLANSLNNFFTIAGSKELSNARSEITNQTVNLTTALSEQAAVLNQVGLGYRQFSENVDTAIYSFGLNADQVQRFNFEIKEMADTMNMIPSQVSSNFNRLTKSMAYDLETIRGQFIRFQKLSLQTGVGFDTLTSKFGSNMDTISGASSAAANINMLLGRNAFSATEILTMPDAERAEAMRDAIMSDSSIMADIDRGGATGKFALQTVAENMNMSVDEARRFITTGEKPEKGKEGSVKSEVGKAIEKNLNPAQLKKFGKGLESLGDIMEKVGDQILQQATPTERAIIRARRSRLANLREGTQNTSLFTDFGVNLDLGVMPEGLDNQTVAQTLFQGGQIDRDVLRMIKTIQSGQLDPKDLIAMVDTTVSDKKVESLSDVFNLMIGPGSTIDSKNQAAEAIAQATKVAEGKGNALESVLKKLSPGARSGFSTLRETSEYGARILARRLIEMDRNEELDANLTLINQNLEAKGLLEDDNTGLQGVAKIFGKEEETGFGDKFTALFRKKKGDRFTATKDEAEAFETSAFGRGPKSAVPGDNAGTRPAVITGDQLKRERAQPTGKPTKKVSGQTVFGTTFIFRAESAVINGVHTKGPVEISAQSAMETVAPE